MIRKQYCYSSALSVPILAPDIASMTSAKKYPLVASAIVLLAVFIYWPSLAGEFVVDDLLWALQPAPPLGEVVSRALFAWGFNESVTGVAGPPIFRPVASIFVGLQHWAFGPNPLPYRLVALLLHGLNAVLVLVLLGKLFSHATFALRAWGALFFLAHPALVESVAWISATAELLMTSFVLLAVLFFLRSIDRQRASSGVAFAVCALAAILSKEAALALPLILALIQYHRRAPLWVPEVIGTVAMVGAYLVWRHVAIENHATVDALAIAPMRVLEYALAHFRYLALPGQQPFSIAPPGTNVTGQVSALVALGLLVVVIALTLRYPRDLSRPVMLGLGWIGVALWPAYAVALVGEGYFAGRHAYLPAIGLTIVLTAVFSCWQPVGQRLSVLLAVSSIATLGVLSFIASGYWSSNLSAYQRATLLSPQASGPWSGLGHAHLENDRFDEAVKAFRMAVRTSHNAQTHQDSLYTLAFALARQGHLEESSNQLQRVTQMNPLNSTAWNGLGNNAWALGRLDLAEQYYREALRVHPGNHEAQSNLMAATRARTSPGSTIQNVERPTAP